MKYEVLYAIAWVNAAIGVVAAVLAAAGFVAHPSWLSSDLIATATIVMGICGGLATILPQVTRTPATREAKYLAAMAGALPADVAQKHGLTVVNAGDHLEVSSPEKPLDTL